MQSLAREKKRKFSNILINPKYQLKQVLFIASNSILIVFSYSILVYYYVRENYDVLIKLSPMSNEVKNQLYREIHQLFFLTVITSLAFILATSLISLILSHRTAGALFHFSRVFSEIKNGNTDARIQLRAKDDFKETADLFNEMMDTLSKKSH